MASDGNNPNPIFNMFPCMECSSQTQPASMMPQGFVLLQSQPPPPPASPPPTPSPPPPTQSILCPMCAQIASRITGSNCPSGCPLRQTHDIPLLGRPTSYSPSRMSCYERDCVYCSLPSKRADSALFKVPGETNRNQKYLKDINDMLDEKIDKILKPVLLTIAKLLPDKLEPTTRSYNETPTKEFDRPAFLNNKSSKPIFINVSSDSDDDNDDNYLKFKHNFSPLKNKKMFESTRVKTPKSKIEILSKNSTKPSRSTKPKLKFKNLDNDNDGDDDDDDDDDNDNNDKTHKQSNIESDLLNKPILLDSDESLLSTDSREFLSSTRKGACSTRCSDKKKKKNKTDSICIRDAVEKLDAQRRRK